MKRSQINAILRRAGELFREHQIHLPRWAWWSPDDWKKAGPETQEIKDAMLG